MSTTQAESPIDIRYVNPFVEAVDGVFTTMLGLEPKRQALKLSPSESPGPQITSIIGISGKFHGVIALRFPPDTALKLAGRMLGDLPGEVNDEVIDVVAELANMVAGSAKAKMDVDPPLELGLPTVVEGQGYRLKYPSKSFWLEVPFATDDGTFSVEITFSDQASA